MVPLSRERHTVKSLIQTGKAKWSGGKPAGLDLFFSSFVNRLNNAAFKSLKISVTVLVALTLLGLAAAPALSQMAQPPAEKPVVEKQPRRQLILGNKPWTGDFDRMLARRMIRVLVPCSRTLYFTDKGQERGLVAETVRDFERYI